MMGQIMCYVREFFFKTRLLSFKTEGYDPFIDFLKGLCILFVVIQHSIPPVIHSYSLYALWGKMAVPIFLLIQVFHTYRKLEGGGKICFQYNKIWNRVIKPFVIVEIIIVVIEVLLHQQSLETVINKLCLSGGFGAGSYFPWLYLQFSILLVLLAPFFKKHGNKFGLLIAFALVSQLLEVFCCVIDIPGPLFRLGAFRYFFLIYLGYVLATRGYELTKLTFSIGIISFLCLCFFSYFDADLRPFFYTGMPAWRTCHWVNYFYVCYILLFVLRWTYKKLQSRNRILTWIQDMGKYSYEIFMFQMIYFDLCLIYIPKREGLLSEFIYMFAAVIICCIPTVFVKNYFCYKKINK